MGNTKGKKPTQWEMLDAATNILVNEFMDKNPPNFSGYNVSSEDGYEYTVFVVRGKIKHPNDIEIKNA